MTESAAKPGVCKVRLSTGTEDWVAGADTVANACVLAAAVFAEAGVSLLIYDDTDTPVAAIGYQPQAVQE